MKSIKSLARSLQSETFELCQPEGRVVGTPGHASAEAFVARRLKEIGCVPYRGNSFSMPYELEGERFTNFAGVIPGRDRCLAPILVGAHYDSVIEAACADDNGAAIAICLALGQLAQETGGFERDLIIAIFDAEEPPYFQSSSMGSVNFYRHQMEEIGVHAAIVMDLVGHDVSLNSGVLPRFESKWVDAFAGLARRIDVDFKVPRFHDLLFITGSESHRNLPEILDSCSSAKGLKIVPTLNEYVGDMSDHGIFRSNCVPYFFLSCGRWAHYHQFTDTPDRLNYRKMARITGLVLDLLGGLDEAELPPDVRGKDPIEMESRHLRTAVGPILLPILLKKLGLQELRTREDMDCVVEMLAGTGL